MGRFDCNRHCSARADDRLILSGLSDQHAEIAGGDVLEGYVSQVDAKELGRDYLLTPAIGQTSRQRANVVLHCTDRSVPRPASLLLVAADLADHRSPREESRAVEILNSLAVTALMWHDLEVDQ